MLQKLKETEALVASEQAQLDELLARHPEAASDASVQKRQELLQQAQEDVRKARLLYEEKLTRQLLKEF